MPSNTGMLTTRGECEHYSGALVVRQPVGHEVVYRLAMDALTLHNILEEPDDIDWVPDPGPSIYAEIRAERTRQDTKWGRDHDDKHRFSDWIRFLQRHAVRALRRDHRKQLVRVAALAVAAIESWDRKHRLSAVGFGSRDELEEQLRALELEQKRFLQEDRKHR